MDTFKWAEQLMSMDEEVWRRHANPWSGWTRMLVLPLFCAAVWSRVWLGWWALVPVALVVLFVWLNPRLFPVPAQFGHWMSRGVIGERVYLEHRKEIAAHHRRAALVLTWAAVPGVLIMTWGLITLWWEGAVFGAGLAALMKIWFVDRMVWILQDWRAAGRDVPGMGIDELRDA